MFPLPVKRALLPWEYEDASTGEVHVDTAYRDRAMAADKIRAEEEALQERARRWRDGGIGELSPSDRVRLGLPPGGGEVR